MGNNPPTREMMLRAYMDHLMPKKGYTGWLREWSGYHHAVRNIARQYGQACRHYDAAGAYSEKTARFWDIYIPHDVMTPPNQSRMDRFIQQLEVPPFLRQELGHCGRYRSKIRLMFVHVTVWPLGSDGNWSPADEGNHSMLIVFDLERGRQEILDTLAQRRGKFSYQRAFCRRAFLPRLCPTVASFQSISWPTMATQFQGKMEAASGVQRSCGLCVVLVSVVAMRMGLQSWHDAAQILLRTYRTKQSRRALMRRFVAWYRSARVRMPRVVVRFPGQTTCAAVTKGTGQCMEPVCALSPYCQQHDHEIVDPFGQRGKCCPNAPKQPGLRTTGARSGWITSRRHVRRVLLAKGAAHAHARKRLLTSIRMASRDLSRGAQTRGARQRSSNAHRLAHVINNLR